MDKHAVLVVEDEDLHYERLKKLINAHDGVELLGRCTNSEEIEVFLEEHSIDLICLDIGLNDGEEAGIDFVRRMDGIPNLPPIIITTNIGSSETRGRYALEAFQLEGVIDFIEKPVSYKAFTKAVEKIYPTPQEPSQVQIEQKHLLVKSKIIVKGMEEFVIAKIRYDDILYVSRNLTRISDDPQPFVTNSNQIKIFTQYNEFALNRSLSKMESLLPQDIFCRIQDSHIVNANHIESVGFGKENSFLTIRNHPGALAIGGEKYRQNLPKEFIEFAGK